MAPPVALPPADLPADLAQLWTGVVAELESRGSMASAFRTTDTTLVRCLCEAVSVHRTASADLHDRGLSIEGRFCETANPSLRAQRDSAATILRVSAELGLSPASRCRLGLEMLVGATLLEGLQQSVAAQVVAAVKKSAAAKKRSAARPSGSRKPPRSASSTEPEGSVARPRRKGGSERRW